MTFTIPSNLCAAQNLAGVIPAELKLADVFFPTLEHVTQNGIEHDILYIV
uniref:Uncharacterized protein n=1 Tax=viral metagenome TaxID=1070528 RepID=A0A6C0ATQ7_9ZZZZ